MTAVLEPIFRLMGSHIEEIIATETGWFIYVTHRGCDDDAATLYVMRSGLTFEKEPPIADQEWLGVYPGHCINPETCRGYTHCPRKYSCVE